MGNEIYDDSAREFAGITEDEAEYSVKRILSARDALARVKENCAARIEHEEKNLERVLAYHEVRLEIYYNENPPKRGKTIQLCNGKISHRTTPERLKIVDEAACLEWAHGQLKDAVKYKLEEKFSLDHDVIVQYAKRTGELPAGTEIQPAREKLDVKSTTKEGDK